MKPNQALGEKRRILRQCETILVSNGRRKMLFVVTPESSRAYVVVDIKLKALKPHWHHLQWSRYVLPLQQHYPQHPRIYLLGGVVAEYSRSNSS